MRQLGAKKKTPKEVQKAIAKMRRRRVGAPPAPHITKIRRAMSGATYQRSQKERAPCVATVQLRARSVSSSLTIILRRSLSAGSGRRSRTM